MSDEHVHELDSVNEIKMGFVIPGARELFPGRKEAEQRAFSDPEYVAVEKAYKAGAASWIDQRRAYEAAVRRDLERTGEILKDRRGCGDVWQDPIDDALVEADAEVVRLRGVLAHLPALAHEWKSLGDGRYTKSQALQVAVELDRARQRARERLSRDRAQKEREEGTVMTPDARAWLSHLVELNGVEAVCAKFGVSAEIVRRLIKGIPTPPTWREVPSEAVKYVVIIGDPAAG